MTNEKIKEQGKKTAIVKAENGGIIELTPETIRAYINPDVTPSEITLFLNQCAMFELNPFKREIYLIKYGKNYKADFVVGYEVYLKRADRSKLWAGLKFGTEGSMEKGNLIAWCKVYRKDWKEPLEHQVEFEEYAQKTKEGNLNRFWKNKPKTMLKKVAVAQGLRMAFPDEFAGMPYIAEERVEKPERLPDALERFTETTEEDEEKEGDDKEKFQLSPEIVAQITEPIKYDQGMEITKLMATLVDKFKKDPLILLDKIQDGIEERFGVKIEKIPDELNNVQADAALVYLRKELEVNINKQKKESDARK